MNYKKGDKVVVEIVSTDTSRRPYEIGNSFNTVWLEGNQILGKVENFQPTQEEIKMTAEEKKEFDKLKKTSKALYLAFFKIAPVNYPRLAYCLFGGTSSENNRNQLGFARAWGNPELIEVEKEKKYWIKLADGYLVNVMGDWLTLKNKKDGDIFTQFEIDRLQERFKAIDLNKCKEEVEDENE